MTIEALGSRLSRTLAQRARQLLHIVFLDLPSCLKKKKKQCISCAIQNEGQFRCAEEGETVLFNLILAWSFFSPQ